MHVIRPNCIDLDVEPIGPDELLVDVVAVCSNVVDGWFIHAAVVLLLSEQLLSASPISRWVVNADLMVFGIEWLLNERLFELNVPDKEAVVRL